MKTKTMLPPAILHPTEAEIRERALQIYVQSGWLPGRDLDNWLEAEAMLKAEYSEANGHGTAGEDHPLKRKSSVVLSGR